jgi:hypothetical protein
VRLTAKRLWGNSNCCVSPKWFGWPLVGSPHRMASVYLAKSMALMTADEYVRFAIMTNMRRFSLILYILPTSRANSVPWGDEPPG